MRSETTKRYFPSLSNKNLHIDFLKAKQETDPILQQIKYEKIHNYYHITHTDNEEKNALYLIKHYKVKKKGKYYIKTVIDSHIGYDKIKKKIFSSSRIDEALLNFLLVNKKMATWEWLFDYIKKQAIAPNMLISILNKKLLTEIYEGKITNIKQLNKKFLKSVSFDRFISFDDLITVFIGDRYNTTIINILDYLRISTNPEKDIKYISPYTNALGYQFYDLVYECNLLGIKISYSWSKKRLMDLHTKLSKKITALKRVAIDGEFIKYKNKFIFPDVRFKLLTTHIEFADEGEEMNHCLFSNNYFTNAVNRKIIIISFRDESIEGFVGKGTAEISFNQIEKTANIIQFRGRFNKEIYKSLDSTRTISDTIAYTKLNELINSEDFINWCLDEKITSTDTKTYVVDALHQPIREEADYLHF